MNLLGVKLALLMGPMAPLPVLPPIMESMVNIEVNQTDEGPSGFQITFRGERRGLMSQLDYALQKMPQIRMFNRVVIVVTFQLPIPIVIMDGIITNMQLTPASGGKNGYITVTGEDVSVMMDRKEVTMEHPGQAEMVIANKIIATYASYGMIPKVIPPMAIDVPVPTERTPVQIGTDLDYLRDMAARYGYVFYVKPGPVPGVNTAYWGPPERVGVPQSALSANMGSHSNVESISFSQDGLAPVKVKGKLQDRRTNAKLPLFTFKDKRMPPLARQSTMMMNFANTREVLPENIDGQGYSAAMARVQGMTDASVDNVVVAQGELDTAKYGHVLQSRGIVGVRGAGDTYNGMYYVKEVKHHIRKGKYKQSFKLTREGYGSITPIVRP